MLLVRFELGSCSGELAAAIAGLIEEPAGVAQQVVDFGQPCPELFAFELQQAIARLRGVAFGFKVGGMFAQLDVLRLTL